jgi:hypothetical protein
MRKLGIIIVLVGLTLTVFSTFSFFSKDKVVTLGKVEITKKVEHRLNISPLIGILIMGIGGIVYWQTYNA